MRPRTTTGRVDPGVVEAMRAAIAAAENASTRTCTGQILAEINEAGQVPMP